MDIGGRHTSIAGGGGGGGHVKLSRSLVLLTRLYSTGTRVEGWRARVQIALGSRQRAAARARALSLSRSQLSAAAASSSSETRPELSCRSVWLGEANEEGDTDRHTHTERGSTYHAHTRGFPIAAHVSLSLCTRAPRMC